MKLLVESLRSNTSQRCSKTMPKIPPTERWDMCMKVNLKESKDNLGLRLIESSSKNRGKGNEKSNGWKAYKVETNSKETKVEARGTRILPTRTYFPTHPKAKLHPSHRGGGEVEEKFERNMGAKGPQSNVKQPQAFGPEESAPLEAPPNL